MKSLHVLPVQAKSMDELKERLRKEAPHADILEIWLDSISDLRLAEIFFIKDEALKPFLFVNKAPFEGGNFLGTSKERIALLIEAIERGGEFVDVAIQTEPELIKSLVKAKKAAKQKTKLIISYHNFKITPSLNELKEIVEDGKKKGADIVKIATFTKNMDENVTLFELTKWAVKKRIVTSVVGMGQKGEISRVICPLLGSALYYAPLNEQYRTAPGQLTVHELNTIWSHLKY